MAFDTVSRADNVPARLFQAAHLLRSGAAGMKITPLRRIKRGGDFSGKRHGHLMQASGSRHGLKEGLGIGVPCAVEFISSEFLDNFAEIHDQNAAAYEADYGQVMGDEEKTLPKAVMQVAHGVEHLSLNGRVQCGNRFVADHEIGIGDERTGKSDALTLTSGKFVGIAVSMPASPTSRNISAVRSLTASLVYSGCSLEKHAASSPSETERPTLRRGFREE